MCSTSHNLNMDDGQSVLVVFHYRSISGHADTGVPGVPGVAGLLAWLVSCHGNGVHPCISRKYLLVTMTMTI